MYKYYGKVRKIYLQKDHQFYKVCSVLEKIRQYF